MKIVIAALLSLSLSAFAQSPQIPLTGNIGVQGNVAILGGVTVQIPSDANYTLTPYQWWSKTLIITSATGLTATRNVVAPLNKGQEFNIENSTTGGQSITVIGATGTGVTIANGASAALFSDGTNYIQMSGVNLTASNYSTLYAFGGVIAGANFTGLVKNNGTSGPPTAATNSDVVPIFGTPSVGQVLTATGATSASWQSLPPSLPTAPVPIAHYQFLEPTITTGTVIHDSSGANFCSGAPCNWTVTVGTPAGAVSPVSVPGANGLGAGIGMGSSPNADYGLPTTNVGTSCQTLPVLQSQVKTVAIQFWNPPLTEVYNLGWYQPFLYGPPGTSGHALALFGAAQPLYYPLTGGNSVWDQDNLTGIHDLVISMPASGASSVYIDGLPAANLIMNNPVVKQAVAFVLGCANGLNGYGQLPGSPLYIFDLMLGSNTSTAADAQQYHAYASYQLYTAKSFNANVAPIQGQANSNNQLVASGDSTSTGEQGGASGVAPYAFCLQSGISNCYSGGYSTALPNINNSAWTVNWFGQSGASPSYISFQAQNRENKVFGSNNGLHVALNWTGINGISSTLPVSCSWAETVKNGGWDAWLMTLYSLSNTSTEQTSRDPYNANLLAAANGCGFKVINVAEDAFMGKDSQNGTVPYWCTSSGGVHACANGYAYVSSIVKRVLSNYYQANMNLSTVYSAPTVTMNGYDRNVLWNTASNAIAATLPDCIGMGGSGIPYKWRVKGSNSLTLTAATVTGQTETINGTTSQTLPAGVYNFQVMTNATASSNPGGCDWEQVP